MKFTKSPATPAESGQYLVKTTHKEQGAREVFAVWTGTEWVTAPGREVTAWAYPLQPKHDSYRMSEDLILFTLAGKETPETIARHVGRTAASVKVRAHLLGLSLAIKKGYEHWNARDEKILIELFRAGFRGNALADKLGRSYRSISGKLEAFKRQGILPRRGRE